MNKNQIYQLDGLTILEPWKAPAHHAGFYHRIPIELIETVRGVMKAALLDTNYTYKFRFRGGTRKPKAQSTPKAQATHFAVFIQEKPEKVQPLPKVPRIITHEGRRYQLIEE